MMDEAPKATELNPDDDAVTLKLSLQDFIRYTQAKGIVMQCPSCFQNEPGWNLYQNRRGNLVLPAGLNENIFAGGGVATFGMRCANCGFVRLYDLAHVAKWLEDNKE